MKHKIITSAALAATLGLITGCSSSHTSSCAPANKGQAAEAYPPPAASVGAPPAEMGTQAGTATAGEGNTVIPLNKEEVHIGTQQASGGEIKVRKYITTRTVNQPVQIREETVSVERVPSAQGAGGGGTTLNQPFQGGEIVIPLVKETPVITKQVVPNGAVVIHRQGTTQTVNVQGEVRSEEVATEGGNVNVQGQGAAPQGTGQAGGTGGSSQQKDPPQDQQPNQQPNQQ